MPTRTNGLKHIFFSVIMAFTSVLHECTASSILPKSLFILTNTMKTANSPIISRRILTKRLLILSGLVILHISKQPIVMDLFSRKIISWNILGKPDVDLVMTAFKKAYTKRNAPLGLMFHSNRGTQYTALHSSSYWILWMLYSHFPRKDILSIMPAVNVSSSTLKKKKLTVKHIIPWRNSSYQCSNTWKDSIMPRDHIVLSEWWHQMKKKNGTGHSSKQLYSALFLYKLCLLYWL